MSAILRKIAQCSFPWSWIDKANLYFGIGDNKIYQRVWYSHDNSHLEQFCPLVFSLFPPEIQNYLEAQVSENIRPPVLKTPFLAAKLWNLSFRDFFYLSFRMIKVTENIFPLHWKTFGFSVSLTSSARAVSARLLQPEINIFSYHFSFIPLHGLKLPIPIIKVCSRTIIRKTPQSFRRIRRHPPYRPCQRPQRHSTFKKDQISEDTKCI